MLLPTFSNGESIYWDSITDVSFTCIEGQRFIEVCIGFVNIYKSPFWMYIPLPIPSKDLESLPAYRSLSFGHGEVDESSGIQAPDHQGNEGGSGSSDLKGNWTSCGEPAKGDEWSFRAEFTQGWLFLREEMVSFRVRMNVLGSNKSTRII